MPQLDSLEVISKSTHVISLSRLIWLGNEYKFPPRWFDTLLAPIVYHDEVKICQKITADIIMCPYYKISVTRF